jgi:hypothetical protein
VKDLTSAQAAARAAEKSTVPQEFSGSAIGDHLEIMHTPTNIAQVLRCRLGRAWRES